ncbi:MAG: M3 family oligoendopeptidase [Phycisphaerae bacterium]
MENTQSAAYAAIPRRFLAEDADLGDWPTVERYYQALADRPIASVDALEAWLLDLSELDGWLGEEGSRRYVAMTCQTDDPEREKRYLSFIEEIVPRSKTWSHRLDRKLLECDCHDRLPADRYAVLVRRIKNRVALFREENVPLQTEDEKLRQRYQKLVGGLVARHDGREQTMQQMQRYLQEPDRAVRREAWEKCDEQWASARDEIDAIYDEMVKLRHRIARNAGCADYREYAFRELERFDYTASDCEAFAAAIEDIVVPAARQLADRRKARLGLDTLRPWDMAVDPQARPPLRPFEAVSELVGGCERIFSQVDPDFGAQFAHMRREGLLDLESRKGKAPGGYMMTYEGRRLPFIFMNAVGTQRDIETLLHEGGHAFHAFAARDEPLTALRDAPIEFAEVASMGMELLAGRFLDAFYRAEEHERAVWDHLAGIVRFFPYMAMIDMLQHWVYTHPNHTREQRRGAWLALNRKYAGWVDYGGYEESLACAWHRKGHPFTVPFYYVEYGIAQLGALGVWLNAKTDYAKAVRDYRAGLALGGTRPLADLFAAANVRLDFTAAALAPAVAEIQRRLAE